MEVKDFPICIQTVSINLPRLEVYYPQVCSYDNPEVTQMINSAIIDAMNQLNIKQGYYENPMVDITGNYELKNNQRGILSLNLINYGYAGGAHGMTFTQSLTFDIETGKSYSLAELFKKNSDYQKRLSDIIKIQIEERGIQVLEPFKEIKPDQDYYIADKVLVIYFQLYELAAYVAGFVSFPISVYEIEDIIDEEGPLGRML